MRTLGIHERFIAFAIFLGVAIAVAGTRMAAPDPRGFGTHEWFGLHPCRTMQWFNVPCAFCGVTTSLSLAARGRLSDALRCQPLGLMLFMSMVAAGGMALIAAAIGKAPCFTPSRRVTLFVTAIVLTAVVFCWIYKIAAYRCSW